LTICHFLFCPTDAAGDKKRAAPRDRRPLARLGAWLLLSTAEVFFDRNEKLLTNAATFFPGRAAG